MLSSAYYEDAPARNFHCRPGEVGLEPTNHGRIQGTVVENVFIIYIYILSKEV